MTEPIPTRVPLPTTLEGRTVVLVGGSSGVGLAAGELLVAVGARVLLVGRDQSRLDAAAATLSAGRPDADVRSAVAEVTDAEALGGAFAQAGEVDHVLVTAGGPAGIGPIVDIAPETARAVVGDTVTAALTVTQTAVPRLRAGGSLTFSSGILVARPRAGMVAPVAAAGAVETFARALAVELAPARLRTNVVRYGATDTPLLRRNYGLAGSPGDDDAMAAAGRDLPLGRFGTAAEAASVAVFLMSNPYMTGEVITVDGGQSLV